MQLYCCNPQTNSCQDASLHNQWGVTIALHSWCSIILHNHHQQQQQGWHNKEMVDDHNDVSEKDHKEDTTINKKSPHWLSLPGLDSEEYSKHLLSIEGEEEEKILVDILFCQWWMGMVQFLICCCVPFTATYVSSCASLPSSCKICRHVW